MALLGVCGCPRLSDSDARAKKTGSVRECVTNRASSESDHTSMPLLKMRLRDERAALR